MPTLPPEPPRRVICAGQPCLIVNGRRLWSAPPPPERYGDEDPPVAVKAR